MRPHFFLCSVLVAERAACRRLISLICAGWVPHDNRLVGELPRSNIEGHSVAGRLIAVSRVLPPLPTLLPTRCMFILDFSLMCRWTGYCLADRPDVARELARHGRAGLHALLASRHQVPVALAQALLCLPGNVLDGLGSFALARSHPRRLARRVPVGPGRFDQQAPHVTVAGLGDRAADRLGATGMFARHQAEVGHELPGAGEAV